MTVPSKLLREAMAILEKSAQSGQITPKMKGSLTELAAEVERVATALGPVEDVIAFDDIDLESDRIGAAKDIWAKLPYNGPVHGAEIKKLVRTSPLLDSLFRRGVDIRSVRRFAPKEIQFSKRIGDQFATFSPGLREIRRMRSEKENERAGGLKCSTENGAFLRFLKGEGVAEPKLMLIRTKENQKKPLKLEWFKDQPERDVFTVLSLKSPDRFRLLYGEWLDAYVYQIIEDHLERNDEPFELYTEVAFAAPGEFDLGAGEFDVLGKVRSRVVCIECKSGTSLLERKIVQDIANKANALRRTMNAISKDKIEFFFYLVFDPSQNDEGEIAAALTGSEVKPLRPDQVRAEIVQNFLP